MPRRQNVGVQVGAPVVPVLQGLSRLADAALRETKSLSADLRHVRGALLAHINDVADKTRTQLRTEFEELATTFKQQAKREAERGYIAVKTTAQEAAETAVAQLRLEHEKELQSIKNEMDQLQREFKQDLDGWQRQCYYYKTSEATLRREVDALRMAMPKSATHAQRIVASPRALQVHDDAKLLEEMHEKEVDLESARREVKTLSLEKKRLEFLLRVVRAKASEQLQQAAVREKHLKHELDQTRESLKHTQDLMLSGRKGAEQALREAIERDFQKKAKARIAAELKRADARESAARSAMMSEHEGAIARLHAQHRAQIESLRSAHQQHLAKRETEHKAEIDELNKTWKKKLLVTQKSLQTLGSSEALQSLTARQAKLMELSARLGHPRSPSQS